MSACRGQFEVFKMAQHWLLSSKSKDLCPYKVAKLSEDEAHDYFCEMRWGGTDRQACPECGTFDKHYYYKKRKQWQCKACTRFFSVTSNSVWADRKLPFAVMLYMLIQFTSSSNGVSALKLSKDVGVNYRTALVFCHKLRESIIRSEENEKLEGEIHVDGGHFGGKPRSGQFRHKAKPEAIAEKIRLGKSQGAKRSKMSRANFERKKRNRRIVMNVRSVIPGKGACKTKVLVTRAEDERTAMWIAQNWISPGSLVRTDESPAYNNYPLLFKHETVEHSKEYSTIDGVNNNQAESFFSRLRRSEYGVFHRMEAKYMLDYASEMRWREDSRRATRETTSYYYTENRCLMTEIEICITFAVGFPVLAAISIGVGYYLDAKLIK